MHSKKNYQFGNPIKFTFRKHFCIACGYMLEKKMHSVMVHSKSPEAKSGRYDFSAGDTSIVGSCEFLHKVFHCPQCGKETEPVTQISYEDNEKWLKKAYDTLLKYAKPEQIIKVWIDQNDNISDAMPDVEILSKVLYIVTIGEKEFEIPCSYTRRSRYYELPIQIKKDTGFKMALSELKHQIKN